MSSALMRFACCSFHRRIIIRSFRVGIGAFSPCRLDISVLIVLCSTGFCLFGSITHSRNLIQFLFVTGFCRRLPSDSTSRRPPWLTLSTAKRVRNFHPIAYTYLTHYKKSRIEMRRLLRTNQVL